ncbi:MAG: FAD binding domain-containing protein [Brevibacillus sp.]|nr:FAD binding domain-containing protein [Brevibacillus sp.]
MNAFQYAAPGCLQDALRLLAAYPDAVLLAGGQVVINEMHRAERAPSPLIDLGRIDELKEIIETSDRVWIGAGVTHTQLAGHPAVKNWLPALVQAAQAVGDLQVRNRATVGGTIAYGDSCGDYWPVWYAVGGFVQLISSTGVRQVEIRDWLAGRCSTALRPQEIVRGIILNKRNRSYFCKHQVSAGETVTLSLAQGGETARLAVGGLTELPLSIELPPPVDEGWERRWKETAATRIDAAADPRATRYRKHLARQSAHWLIDKHAAGGVP